MTPYEHCLAYPGCKVGPYDMRSYHPAGPRSLPPVVGLNLCKNPVFVGDYGTGVVGYGASVEAGNWGYAQAGNNGRAKAGDYGVAIAGDYGTSVCGKHGTAISGVHGKATSGAAGISIVGSGGVATVGPGGVAGAADCALLMFGYHHPQNPLHVVYAMFYVGSGGVKPRTLYKLKSDLGIEEVERYL